MAQWPQINPLRHGRGTSILMFGWGDVFPPFVVLYQRVSPMCKSSKLHFCCITECRKKAQTPKLILLSALKDTNMAR